LLPNYVSEQYAMTITVSMSCGCGLRTPDDPRSFRSLPHD
jgi:hypothetical protein